MDSLEQNFDKEEISLKELFYIIKNNLLKLYISIILAIILAFLYIIVTRPIYSTYATILVEEEDSSMSSVFDLGFSSDLNYLDNEIQVLKSRTTAERAVTSLLNSEHINNLHLDTLENDSALVYERASITEAYINKFSIDPDETGSNVQVDRVREFRIENQSNVTRFGAQLMDDSVMDTIAPDFGLN